jgi:hypothetical protein
VTTAAEPTILDAVEPGATGILELGGGIALHLFGVAAHDRGRVAPGLVRFAHDCRMIDEHHRVRCAPALNQGHRAEWREDGFHVSPSILCPDCGTHGFVTASRWESV